MEILAETDRLQTVDAECHDHRNNQDTSLRRTILD
eukprot:jgi/Antlo1/1042/1101